MRCDDLMEQKTCRCGLDSTAGRVLRSMLENSIGTCLVTSSAGELLGTVCIEQLLLQAGDRGVGELISRDWLACAPHDKVHTLGERLSESRANIVVVIGSDGFICGVIQRSQVEDAIEGGLATATSRSRIIGDGRGSPGLYSCAGRRPAEHAWSR